MFEKSWQTCCFPIAVLVGGPSDLQGNPMVGVMSSCLGFHPRSADLNDEETLLATHRMVAEESLVQALGG